MTAVLSALGDVGGAAIDVAGIGERLPSLPLVASSYAMVGWRDQL